MVPKALITSILKVLSCRTVAFAEFKGMQATQQPGSHDILCRSWHFWCQKRVFPNGSTSRLHGSYAGQQEDAFQGPETFGKCQLQNNVWRATPGIRESKVMVASTGRALTLLQAEAGNKGIPYTRAI